jgi:hypothetical protein
LLALGFFGPARVVAFGRSRIEQRGGCLFGQTLVGVWLHSKTVISRANLKVCFISVHAADSLRARPGAKEERREVTDTLVLFAPERARRLGARLPGNKQRY